jgi:acyl carrier protein
MSETDPLFDELREILAETMGADPDEIVPEARFFDDLGGESIDVLDLNFRCEKRYGVPVRFQDLFDAGAWQPAPDGGVAAEDLRRMRERFPFLDTAAMQSARTPGDLKSLFTVGVIVETVRGAINSGTRPAQPREAEAGTSRSPSGW